VARLATVLSMANILPVQSVSPSSVAVELRAETSAGRPSAPWVVFCENGGMRNREHRETGSCPALIHMTDKHFSIFRSTGPQNNDPRHMVRSYIWVEYTTNAFVSEGPN
jgi:hypothetical protein